MSQEEQWIEELRSRIPGHPSAEDCTIAECEVCGIRDCPNGAFEHYWRDGCPGCYEAAQKQREKEAVVSPGRTDTEMLEELLAMVEKGTIPEFLEDAAIDILEERRKRDERKEEPGEMPNA